MCYSWDVLSSERFAGDEKRCVPILREEFHELDEGNVEMIADRVNGLGVAIRIGETEACPYGIVDEHNRVVFMPTPRVFLFCGKKSVIIVTIFYNSSNHIKIGSSN